MKTPSPISINGNTIPDAEDYFRFFEGGRLGVLSRIAERVKACLADMQLSAIDLVARHAGLNTTAELLELINKNPLSIKRSVVERLSERLSFDIRETFGPVVKWEESVTPLEAAAQQSGFRLVAPAEGGNARRDISSKEMLSLFAFLRAYKSLE